MRLRRGIWAVSRALKAGVWAIVTVVGMMLAVPSWAQDNAYGIDDECYGLFREVESLLSLRDLDKAEEVNQRLLSTALEKKDTKAETLHYVERLKSSTRAVAGRKATEEEEKQVLQRMEELKQISRKHGYIQYYYYAYDIVENFYYNQDKVIRTLELVNEMQETAIRNNEPYGVWMGYRYLIQMYVAQADYVSSKPYIKMALKIYEETDDPTIKRQSICRLYCDLADTYPIGNDSVVINIDLAEKYAKQHLDTLRVQYHRAKMAAYDMDIEGYEKAKAYCLSDRLITQISATAPTVFQDLDNIIYNEDKDKIPEINTEGMGVRLRELRFIANIAEKYGETEAAFLLERQIVYILESKLASANGVRITEMDARFGNNILSARVDEQSKRIRSVTILVMALILVILVSALVFSSLYIINLRKTNEKVRMADEAKTRFVQNMSHEVRTPLNAIVGFSQLLSLPDGSFSPEEKDEFAGHIINNTKMLTMLLDDILNASAMDSGMYRITYEDGEVGFMAEAAISSSEHRLQPGVRMYYSPESTKPFTFRTDPRRVQQILINLLTNSCKHTPSGEICLSSSLSETPGYVTYTVTDTGSGIPADQAEKIFDRFAKLNEFVQGTGLGLSICRDIAQRMGAKVWLDTTYNAGGARFKFAVPVVPPENSDNQ